MSTKKLYITSILIIAIIFGAVASAEAISIFSPVTSLARYVAKGIVNVVKGTQKTEKVEKNETSLQNIDNNAAFEQATEEYKQLIATINANQYNSKSEIYNDVNKLSAVLDNLEKLYREDSIDLENAMLLDTTPVEFQPKEVAVVTENLPDLTGKGYVQTDNKLESLKNSDANSNTFESFFANLTEGVKPETKKWVNYTTKTDSQKKLGDAEIDVKMRSGVKLFENDKKDIMLGSYHWDNNKNNSIESQYTSTNLNIDNDSNLMNSKMFKSGNDQFKDVYLNAGNTKFGWTHIAYDRPDGTNHAREIKEAFGLSDQDKSVQSFIQDTIKDGKATEQVRMVDGKPQSRYIYTRDVNGNTIQVVVDNDKYPGSVITAYPKGKVKTPDLAEIQKRIEEEKKKKVADAKKKVKWRSPQIYIDLYKKERKLTLGPQWDAGTSQNFKLGGADIVNSASGNVLLGGEAVGTGYVGINNGNFSAGVRGSVFAGARARGRLSSDVKINEKLGLGGFLGGEVSAGAGANADAHVGIGKDGAIAQISGDAFVGVRAKGSVGGTVSYGDVKVTGGVNGTIGAGLGAHFDVTGKISWSGVKAHVDLGAYLGLGGQVGFDINIDLGKKLEPVKKAVHKVYKKGKEVVDKTVNSVKKTAKSIGKLFGW